MPDARSLLAKIEQLPSERIAEVEDFVEFLTAQEAERGLVRAAASSSAPAFAAVWSNPDDDVYDRLGR